MAPALVRQGRGRLRRAKPRADGAGAFPVRPHSAVPGNRPEPDTAEIRAGRTENRAPGSAES